MSFVLPDVHPGVDGGAVVVVECEAAGGAAREGDGDGGRRHPVGVLKVVPELPRHQQPAKLLIICFGEYQLTLS